MNDEKKQLLRQLLFVFFKIGLFTFGGGYAMIPLIEREVVETKGWIDEERMMDVLAISESTPGPIAINMATFVGYHTAGIWGSVLATAGVVLPSVIVILILSGIYTAFRSNIWVGYAFTGIKSAVCVLLINNIIKLSKQFKGKFNASLVAVGAFLLLAFLNVKGVFVIMGAIAAGIVTELFGINFINGGRADDTV